MEKQYMQLKKSFIKQDETAAMGSNFNHTHKPLLL